MTFSSVSIALKRYCSKRSRLTTGDHFQCHSHIISSSSTLQCSTGLVEGSACSPTAGAESAARLE